jgi:hypothetical protein
MSDARYSQPIEATPRNVGGPVVRVTRGRAGNPVFVFRDEFNKEHRVEANSANSAVGKPRGFFSALARMFGGNR